MSGSSAPKPGSAAAADDDPERLARSILLRQLTQGPRTRAQLRDAMARREVPPDTAEALLDRFEEVGLVDDAAYADCVIRSEAAAGGLSRRRVAHRLRSKGVSDDIVAEAVSGITAEEEFGAALALARRRAPRLAALDGDTRRRRLMGLLARRGYGSQTVQRVVQRVLDES